MKIAKMIGLTAVAVLACTALVGTSSAFASETVLCKASGSYCAIGNGYPSGVSLNADMTPGTEAVLNGGISGSVKCKESSLKGETTAASGEPLAAKVTGWTLGQCRFGARTCTASAPQHLPYSSSIASTEGGNGTISIKGSGGEAGGWHIECPENEVNCTYSFEPTLSVEGGNPPKLSTSKQAIKFSGSSCPKSATFSASYTVSKSQPVFVAIPLSSPPAGVSFCPANESPCNGGAYPSNTKFEGSLASGTSLELNAGTQGIWKCTSSSFAGETTKVGGESLPLSISAFPMSGCTSIWGSCSVVAEGLPYSTAVTHDSETGKFSMNVSNVKWHWTCGAAINCTFSAGATQFHITGGAPAAVEISQTLNKSGGPCPPVAIITAAYAIQSPTPLFPSFN